MFGNGDEAGQRAHWVIDALKEHTKPDSTELPHEVLRWILADPLFILSRHDPGARDWRRDPLIWGTVPKEEGEERDDNAAAADEPFTHTAVSIDRRLSYGRLARYNLHRFVAKDPDAINEAIKVSQKVQEKSDNLLATNFGGYHSKRDLFRSDPECACDSSGIEDFILAAVRAIERKDRAMWEADGEPPEVRFPFSA